MTEARPIGRPFSGAYPWDVTWGVRRHAAAAPHAIALRDDSMVVTYGTLVERMNRVANAASGGMGLLQGQRVGLLSANSARFVEIMLGFASAGMSTALLNARSSVSELVDACMRTEVSAIVVDECYADLLPRLDGVQQLILTDSAYDDWLSHASPSRPVVQLSSSAPFVLPFTGGTTGSPKAVITSHQARTSMYQQMRQIFHCYTPQDRNLTVSPLYHGAGFNFALATLYSGGSVGLLAHFDPERIVDAMLQQRVTNIAMVPTHISALLDVGMDRLRRASPRLTTLMSNGAPLMLKQKETVVDALGVDVLYDVYGSTEAGIISYLKPEEQLSHPDSAGTVFPGNELRVQDEHGQSLARGETGEIATRSPYLFSGYVGGEEHAGDEWFCAGDIGRVDEDGFLYLTGRKGDKLISGGLNVYPGEVEEVLLNHPSVADAAVFAVADDYWGETVRAAVVLHPGASCDEKELMTFAARTLARYKLPKHVHFTKELPRTALGKVLRRELTRTYSFESRTDAED